MKIAEIASKPDNCNQPAQPCRADRDTVRQIASEALLGGERVVLILHEGEAYRLSKTSKGKLILTK